MSDRIEKRIPISIWMKPSFPRLNFCMICRAPLKATIEGYPDEIIFGIDASKMQDTERPLKFPIKIRCEGKSQDYGYCTALYVIQGFIND